MAGAAAHINLFGTMKRKLFLAVLFLVVIGSGYIFYTISPREFDVQDVSKSESFRLYQSGKPMNVDLAVYGNVDSTFTIRVIDLSTKGALFDSSFSRKQVDYNCMIDYYTGRGVEIVYVPKGATNGEVKLSAKINTDF